MIRVGLCLTAAIGMLAYFVCAFIWMDLDAANWPIHARGVAAFAWFVAVVAIWSAMIIDLAVGPPRERKQ